MSDHSSIEWTEPVDCAECGLSFAILANDEEDGREVCPGCGVLRDRIDADGRRRRRRVYVMPTVRA